MKLGALEYFCNCITKNYKEHVTAPDSEGNCVYCGHHAIKRQITMVDIRYHEKNGDRINLLKREYLEVIIKDRRYAEKVN